MQSIETDWQDDRLVVCARGGHAVATPADLRARLADLSDDALLVAAAKEHLQDGHPALTFAACESIDLLLSLDEEKGLSESLALWRWLARFVMDRVAAGQFYPTVENTDQGAIGVWRLLVTGTAELEWLSAIAAKVGALAAHQTDRAERAVEGFLNGATDAVIRRAFSEDSFFEATADRCHKPGASPDARFLGSLLTQDRSIPAANPETVEQIRVWVDVLQDRPMVASFRLALRLLDPSADTDEQQWRVQILMQPLHGDMDAIPAAQLWEMGRELPPILGRSLAAQRESLLAQLREAAEAWPVLGERAGEQPDEITLSAAEAVAFARQWAPRLVEKGVGVELPRWARDPGRELTVQLEVQPLSDEDAANAAAQGEWHGNIFAGGAPQMGLSSILQFDWRVAVGSMQLNEQQFSSILQSGQPLVRFDGEWLQVDMEAARRAMDFIAQNKTGEMTLADALRVAHGTSRSETGLQISGLSGAGWIGELLQQNPDAQIQSIVQPEEFQGQLRPYQLRGLQWLAFLHRLGIGACLADDMGLGKTIQFIALMLQERKLAKDLGIARVGPTLLFAPTSVMGNWRCEMSRFAPSMRLMVHHGVQRLHGEAFKQGVAESDLVITTYALSSRDLEDFMQVRWHRLALDEAQKIKNPSAASTQAIRSIPAGFRVALTGTPHRKPPFRAVVDHGDPQPRPARQRLHLPRAVCRSHRTPRRSRARPPSARTHQAVCAPPHQGRPHHRRRPARKAGDEGLLQPDRRAGIALPARDR